MSSYIGRFAPSPSGPLHMGSLLAATASYLDARCNNGQWLVRIEDIDPPREQPGASQIILETLRAHSLIWDREVLFQSDRTQAYKEILEKLQDKEQLYRCSCTRQRLKTLKGRYDRHCLNHPPLQTHTCALRFKLDHCINEFTDLIQGNVTVPPIDDPVLKRKDGLFSYQLAVVVDDHFQGISHVIRGADLLDTTPTQIALFESLGWMPPNYGHIPLLMGDNGIKLSKQNRASPINLSTPTANLREALKILGIQPTPNADATCQELLKSATGQWSECSKNLAGKYEINEFG